MTREELTTAIIIWGLYMMPTLIAFLRIHHQRWPILLTNLLLGWTLIFWLVALIWSSSAISQERSHD